MISLSFISLIVVVLLCVGILILILVLGIKSQFYRVSTGASGMIGKKGRTTTRVDKNGGKVFVHGEIWNAVSSVSLKSGESIIIKKTEDMILVVEPSTKKMEV